MKACRPLDLYQRGATGHGGAGSTLGSPDEVHKALNAEKDDCGNAYDHEPFLHRLVVFVDDEANSAAAHSDDQYDPDQFALEDVDDIVKLRSQAKGIGDVRSVARGCRSKEIEQADRENTPSEDSFRSCDDSSFSRLHIGNCPQHLSQAALPPPQRPAGRNLESLSGKRRDLWPRR